MQSLIDAGQLTEAKRAWSATAPRGVVDANTAVIAAHLGFALLKEGQDREADSLLTASIAVLSKSIPGDPRLAHLYICLGEARFFQGRLRESAELCHRALTVQRRTLGPNHADVIINLQNLAAIYREIGELHLARKYLDEAVAAFESQENPGGLPYVELLQHVGNLDLATGRLRSARTTLYRALASAEQIEPAPNWPIICILNSLAVTEGRLQQYDKAAILLSRAMRLAESRVGLNHPVYALLLANQGDLHEHFRQFDLADQCFRTATAIQTEKLGADSPTLAVTLLRHARVLAKTGRRTEAKELEAKSRAITANRPRQPQSVSLDQLRKESAP